MCIFEPALDSNEKNKYNLKIYERLPIDWNQIYLLYYYYYKYIDYIIIYL